MREKKYIQTFKTDIPVTREIIKFGWNRIQKIEKVTGNTPRQLLRTVKALELKYNERTISTQKQNKTNISTGRKKTKPRTQK